MTHEQAAWYDMIYRCQNPKHARYPEYGAVGIKVCKQWCGSEGRQTFTDFMGDKPTPAHVLGRKDMTGNYTPENCAWMTRSEARRLQINTVKVQTMNGPVAAVTLANKLGLPERRTRRRISLHGWSPKQALTRELPMYRKLNAEQAIEIYQARKRGVKCDVLAVKYGCSVNMVSMIGRGLKWANVTGATP
jgi:hypothetical protein